MKAVTSNQVQESRIPRIKAGIAILEKKIKDSIFLVDGIDCQAFVYFGISIFLCVHTLSVDIQLESSVISQAPENNYAEAPKD